jgi:DNA polymerase-3 subunit delta
MAKGECFIFAGPEIGEKHDELENLRKRLAGSDSSALETTSFYAGETPVGDIVSLLQNGSLFCDARLILVKSAELIKKTEADILASYINSPNDDTTLVFISDATKIEKKIEDAVCAGGKKNNKRIFWELQDSRKPQWVQNFFSRQGFSIHDDGIAAILEMVENNTDALRRECSMLTLFFGGKNEKEASRARMINAEDVERLLSHTRSESAFTLFSAIAEADFSKSIEISHSLLASGEAPAAIFAGLLWCFHRFRDYCELAARNTLSDFELQKVGITVAKSKIDYRNAVGNFGLNAADTIIALSAEYDLATRADSALQIILMDIYLYKLFGLKKINRGKA